VRGDRDRWLPHDDAEAVYPAFDGDVFESRLFQPALDSVLGDAVVWIGVAILRLVGFGAFGREVFQAPGRLASARVKGGAMRSASATPGGRMSAP
jgi:hypothetical protein